MMLLCANRNNLCFLKETSMLEMLSSALLKGHLGNTFFFLNYTLVGWLIILSSSVLVLKVSLSIFTQDWSNMFHTIYVLTSRNSRNLCSRQTHTFSEPLYLPEFGLWIETKILPVIAVSVWSGSGGLSTNQNVGESVLYSTVHVLKCPWARYPSLPLFIGVCLWILDKSA